MRKLIFVFILFMTLPVLAQSIRWQTFEQSIDSTDADTTWFALRVGMFSTDVDPDSMAIVPPENATIDETPFATFQQIAGTAADSSITYAKPVISVNGVAYIVNNDSIFVTGSTYAAPSSPNIFGNGNLYGKTLTFNTKRFNGVIFITKVFDIVPGSKKFRWGLGTK